MERKIKALIKELEELENECPEDDTEKLFLGELIGKLEEILEN